MITESTRSKLSLQKLGDKNPNWVGGKPKCLNCGEDVSRYKGVKYCIKCYGKTRLGENNPAWKGGVNSDRIHKNERTLNWYNNHKDYHRNWKLNKRFGITIDDYNEMLKKQDGKCAICRGKTTYHNGGHLVIDHCHRTGKIRGLLCTACNLGIGKFKDNPKLLVNASKYLKDVAKRPLPAKTNIGL